MNDEIATVALQLASKQGFRPAEDVLNEHYPDWKTGSSERSTHVGLTAEQAMIEKELANLAAESERNRLAVESYVPLPATAPTAEPESWHKTIATDWYRGEGLIMGGPKKCDPSDSAVDYIAKMSLVAGDIMPIDELSESGKVRAVTLIGKNPLMSGMTMVERFFRTKNLCEQYIAERSQNLLRAKDANKRALDRYP